MRVKHPKSRNGIGLVLGVITLSPTKHVALPEPNWTWHPQKRDYVLKNLTTKVLIPPPCAGGKPFGGVGGVIINIAPFVQLWLHSVIVGHAVLRPNSINFTAGIHLVDPLLALQRHGIGSVT